MQHGPFLRSDLLCKYLCGLVFTLFGSSAMLQHLSLDLSLLTKSRQGRLGDYHAFWFWLGGLAVQQCPFASCIAGIHPILSCSLPIFPPCPPCPLWPCDPCSVFPFGPFLLSLFHLLSACIGTLEGLSAATLLFLFPVPCSHFCNIAPSRYVVAPTNS